MQQRSHKSSPPKARRILGKQSTFPRPANVATPRPTKAAVIQRTFVEPPILEAAHPVRVVAPARPTRTVAARSARVATRQCTHNIPIEPPILGATRPASVKTIRPTRGVAARPARVETRQGTHNIPIEPPILEVTRSTCVKTVRPTRAVAARPARVETRQGTHNIPIEPPILEATRPARVENVRPARAVVARPARVATMQGAAAPAKSPTFMTMAMASENALQFNIDIDRPENSIKRNIEFFLSVLPSVTVAATLLILVSGIFYYAYATKISARASELRDIAIITAPTGSKTDIRSVVTRLVYDSQWKPEDVASFLNIWQRTDATHKAMLTKKYWYKKFLLELRSDIKSVLDREDMTKQEREALISLATNVGVLDSRYSTFR